MYKLILWDIDGTLIYSGGVAGEAREDDEIVQLEQRKFFFFFTFSRLICEHQQFLVYAPPETLSHDFNVFPGRVCRRGCQPASRRSPLFEGQRERVAVRQVEFLRGSYRCEAQGSD